MSLYRLTAFEGGSDEFLAILAHKKGKLKKKGFPDLRGAARVLIQDWSSGKIRFYKLLPNIDSTEDPTETSLVVRDWSAEFDIESLLKCEQEELQKLEPAKGLGVQLREELDTMSTASEDENASQLELGESEDDNCTMDLSSSNEYCISNKK